MYIIINKYRNKWSWLSKTVLVCPLAMSPIGEGFRNRLRMFPSLINCCTIDWFQAWPKDALEMVANKFLEDLDLEDNIRIECGHEPAFITVNSIDIKTYIVSFALLSGWWRCVRRSRRVCECCPSVITPSCADIITWLLPPTWSSSWPLKSCSTPNAARWTSSGIDT